MAIRYLNSLSVEFLIKTSTFQETGWTQSTCIYGGNAGKQVHTQTRWQLDQWGLKKKKNIWRIFCLGIISLYYNRSLFLQTIELRYKWIGYWELKSEMCLCEPRLSMSRRRLTITVCSTALSRSSPEKAMFGVNSFIPAVIIDLLRKYTIFVLKIKS